MGFRSSPSVCSFGPVLRDAALKKKARIKALLKRKTARGPGRSHADRGLEFGECKEVFAFDGNLTFSYEAFMTAFLIRLGRSTKKYLRTNIPWRPRKEPPQFTHLTSRSAVGWGGTSTRTTWYFAPQLGQSNGTDCESGIMRPPKSQIIPCRKEIAQ